MAIIAYGSTPDDFTGWGGTGSPSYTSVNVVTTTAGYWLFTRFIGSLAVGTNGFGRGCAWLPFKTSTNSFTMALKGGLQGYGIGSTTDTAVVVIHNKTMTAWFVLRFGFVSGNNSSMAWYMTTDLTDSTKYVNLSGVAISSTQNASDTMTLIEVSGAGTTAGKINFYADVTEGYPAGTLTKTWTGDLTDYKDFSAVSIHAPGPTSASLFNLVSVAVSTTPLRGCRITEVAGGTTTSPTTYAEWVGSLSQWVTAPVNYASYGTGLYAYAVGNRKTFVAGDETSIPARGYEIRNVSIRAALVGGMNTTTQVSAYAHDPTTGNSATGTTVYDCVDSGGILWQSWDTDPITGLSWTDTNFARYEFGVVRVK